MGLSYGIVTGSVLVGMAIVLAILQRNDGLRTWAPIVSLVGLLYAGATAITAAIRPVVDAATRDVNGAVTNQMRVAPIFVVIGVIGAALFVSAVLHSRWQSADEDEPARSTPFLAWLGVAGLVLLVAAKAPSPLRLHHADIFSRSNLATYAFAAFVLGVAAIGLLHDRDSRAVVSFALVGVGAGLLAIAVSAADEDTFRAFLAGCAVGLLVPVAVAAVADVVRDKPATALVTPVAAGIVVLLLAGYAQGWSSRLQNPGMPRVIPGTRTQLPPAIACPTPSAGLLGPPCPAPYGTPPAVPTTAP